METSEVIDFSYFGTPLYNKQKTYVFDGYYFANKNELLEYVLEYTKVMVLGSNLDLRQ